MKLKIKTNFSFNKLSNQLDNLIDGYTASYAKDSAEGTRKNIDRGVGADGKTLKLGKGSYREGKQALFNTGKMYRSLKNQKNTLSIKKYGYKHNEGEFPVRSGTNVKNFIGTTKNNKQKIDKKFMQDINKALKK